MTFSVLLSYKLTAPMSFGLAVGCDKLYSSGKIMTLNMPIKTVKYVVWDMNLTCKSYVQCIFDRIFTYVNPTEVRYILNYSPCRVKFERSMKFVYATLLVTRFLLVTRIRFFQHFRQFPGSIHIRSCEKIL